MIRELSEKDIKEIERLISLIQDKAIMEKVRAEGNEKRFAYKGFECVILRCGVHLCGYIGIPKGHKYYGKDYNYIDANVDVHGGLTYAQEDNGIWVIGFDCAHYGDYTGFSILGSDGTYKNMEYVEKQIKNLVRQIS
ncbi:MAG: hypothetical protein LBQ73_05000 [Tannerellaceae bacterium]|jgi:hypothetical protein|nr:hypothetical protein [Tannerellaceae bacterium]